jgi:hypothetical protein
MKFCEECCKAFFGWCDSFTECMHHFQKPWMHCQSSQKLLKKLLGDQKLTPGILLINLTIVIINFCRIVFYGVRCTHKTRVRFCWRRNLLRLSELAMVCLPCLTCFPSDGVNAHIPKLKLNSRNLQRTIARAVALHTHIGYFLWR